MITAIEEYTFKFLMGMHSHKEIAGGCLLHLLHKAGNLKHMLVCNLCVITVDQNFAEWL